MSTHLNDPLPLSPPTHSSKYHKPIVDKASGFDTEDAFVATNERTASRVTAIDFDEYCTVRISFHYIHIVDKNDDRHSM
jgi:hypothetical protein